MALTVPPVKLDTDTVATLADAERTSIVRALRAAQGRISGVSGAAALLGLKPTTLHAKMEKLGVGRAHAFGQSLG